MTIAPKINNPTSSEPKSDGAKTANITKNITVSGLLRINARIDSIIAEKIFIVVNLNHLGHEACAKL